MTISTSTSTYEGRMALSTSFEEVVRDALRSNGWDAEWFGQSLIAQQMKKHLRDFRDDYGRPCRLRWFQDIITARRTWKSGRTSIALIDAKACFGKPNVAIELDALLTAEGMVDVFYTPTYFVCSDESNQAKLLVLSPYEARLRMRMGEPSKNGNGSGTAYVLVAKRYGLPFDNVFPPSEEPDEVPF